MKTAEQREADFRADLAALLAKHEAEIKVEEDWEPYGISSRAIEVVMMCEWNEEGEQVSEYAEFRL